MEHYSESIGKISRGFQFTLPPEFRNKMGLQIGDYLRTRFQDGALIVESVEIKPKRITENLEKALAATASVGLNEQSTAKLVRDEVKAHRKEKRHKNKSDS